MNEPVWEGLDFIALYVPPETGWPWITLVSITASPYDAAQMNLKRGRYMIEVDETEDIAVEHCRELKQIMGAQFAAPSDVVQQ